ncbi:ankyrin repeat domain-containing protein [Arenimonas sp.]|uniref:ankyrin repeat domain-containing protein n=1 Tax=Arenimonas sp. TaxID=1872635 RepID=UPI0039E411C5
MVESRRGPWPWVALALGLALASCAAWQVTPWMLLALAAAQPLIVLGWSGVRGTRPPAPLREWATEAFSLLSLWGMAFLFTALVVAWPLESLRESGSLPAALGLSLCIGFVLLGLWRLWPAFALAATQRQGFPALMAAASREGGRESLRGLGVALMVFVVLAAGLVLCWSGPLLPSLHFPFALSFPLLCLVVHAGLHALSAPTTASATSPAKEEAQTAAEPLPETLASVPVEDRLFAALRAGKIEAALGALREGANPNARPDPGDRDQRTLPMLAVLHGDLRLLRELIARGIDLNLRHGGLTPLLAATRDSWHGRPEAVMTLLANGADPRTADGEGNTSLHHAARSTDAAVAALLLDAGAQIDALNNEGYSPLGLACEAANWRLARFLIEHGAKPEPADGQPALLAAASGEDDPVGVQLLLRHKARVDARGQGQRTALMQACAVGNADVVSALLEAGADRNAQDAERRTPLLEAARNGHSEVLARLAPSKPDARAVDTDGANALLLACRAGATPDFLRHLMALGVDALQPDARGMRAIDEAIAHGRWPLVAVLDPDYPLPSNVAEGLTAGHFEKTSSELLREALSSRRWESAVAMLRLGVGPGENAMAQMLIEFSSENDLAVFDWLRRHGASADTLYDGHDSAFFHLLDRGGHALPALVRLLEHGQAVGGTGGLARYLRACFGSEHINRSYEQFALMLLERGADAFSPPSGQDPPVILAIRLGWQRLLEAALAAGVDPNQRDARGYTAVHVAASLGRESALRALIKHGALADARAPDGQTALGMALAAGRRDLSHWLEWRGWNLPGRRLQAADLPAAAMAGAAEAVQRLLDLDLPIDAVDHQGCTALLRAAGGGHLSIVESLIARGADLQASARTGATPLSAAISMRHGAVVEALLQSGADPNRSLPGGVTPLMLACALGLPEISARLLARGAGIEAVDDQGHSALHCAALHAFTARDRVRALALFDLLLQAELPADGATAQGHTPVMLLLGARAEAGAACDEEVLMAVLDRLLTEGVSLDSQDRRGLTVLHLAAQHGLLRVVQRLLREGADRQRRDALGRTPQELALLRGYVDIAAEFESSGRLTAPSLARFLRDR